MKARAIRPGEIMAIAPSAIHRGADGFFLMFGPEVPDNERIGKTAVVHVRGPLEHHIGDGGDSYESILLRVCAAYDGSNDGDNDADDQNGPAEAVVIVIDSPGGVVSGLNETVAALKKLREKKGKPLVAFVNEMAASAAYALCCACDEVLCPPSAILGSIGVISTMMSQSDRDDAMGYDIRLITSGERKADGHVHAPITDSAIKAETARVAKLAKEFFRIASKSRRIPSATIEGFQAGIFLGKDAVRVGLADAVMCWDDVVGALADASDGPEKKYAGNVTRRRVAKNPLDKHAKATSSSNSTRDLLETDMPIQLTANRKKLEAAVAVEKDPKKLAALRADLEAYKKVEKHIEHTKSEEDDDPEDDEGDDEKKKGEEDEEEEDDEESAKKSSKKSAKSEEEEEEEEEEESSSAKDEKKAALTVYRKLSATLGVRGAGVSGALAAVLEKAAKYDNLAADVAKLKSTQTKAAKNALIDEAVAQRRITRKQASTLRTEKLGFVESFLKMHPTALVNIDDEALHVPDGTPSADIPANVKKIVEQAVESMGLVGEAAEKFRTDAYADHRKASANSTAGAY